MTKDPKWERSSAWRPWPIATASTSTAMPATVAFPSSSSGQFQQLSDDEALSQVKARLLGSLELLGELTERSVRRRESASARDLEFTKLHGLMGTMKHLHEKEVAERSKAENGLRQLSEEHRSTQARLKELEEEAGALRESSLNDSAKIQELTLALASKDKEMEDLRASKSARTAELEHKHVVLSAKVVGLETACSAKDQHINSLKEKYAELEQFCESAEAKTKSLESELLDRSQLIRSREDDITWLLQKGVPGAVQVFLSSDDFVNRNIALQEEGVRLGQYQGCVDTKSKFPELLGDKDLVYDFPQAGQNVVDLFADLMSTNYDLLHSFEHGVVSLEELKKLVGDLPQGPEDVAESSDKNKKV